MKILFLLLIITISFSLSAERLLFDKYWKLTEMPDRAVYFQKEEAKKNSGVWQVKLFYLETGNIFFNGANTSANVSEGNIVGDFEFFYSDGQLYSKGSSDSNGYYQGEYLQYWQSGTIEKMLFYQNRELNGEQKEYYETGKPRVRYHMKDGIKLGLEESYFGSGQLHTRVTFGTYGMEGLYERFYINGQKEEVAYMVAGKRDGERLYWSNEGWLFSKEFYLKGKLHGEVLNYQSDSVLSNIKNYQHGKEVGVQKYFNAEGRLNYEVEYDNNGREVKGIQYDSTGSIVHKSEIEYLSGGKIITQQDFSSTGELVYLYQSDTVKDWSLRQRFDLDGKLKSREELINGLYEGLYISPGWHGVQYVNYSMGKKHGVYIEDYYDGGSVTGLYHHDFKVGKWVTLSTDRIRLERYNQHGELHGEQTDVASDGTVMYQAFYEEGKLHGAYMKRDYTRKLIGKGNYINGLREGQWIIEDDYNYSIVWHGEYRNGHKIGSWRGLSMNGHLLGLKQYDDGGELQGKRYLFHEDGSLVLREEYFDKYSEVVYYYEGEPSSAYQNSNDFNIQK